MADRGTDPEADCFTTPGCGETSTVRGRVRPPWGRWRSRCTDSASCDHGIKRLRLYLTREQIASVAYGLWLHRMTGSAAQANRFAREYGVVHSPARASGKGPPVARGGAGDGGRG
ncbi:MULTISPECIES: DUF6417 family protein [Streptomyces]|uniref:DUF6417 family protein n=1 Tax=Streptomyces TaxID=1883 RepID=UPI0033A72249